VIKYKYDWKKIVKKFNIKFGSNCPNEVLRQRYKDITSLVIPKRVKFTQEEDVQLSNYYEIYGSDWVKIASHFANRTPQMIKNRFYSHIRKMQAS